MNCTKLPAILPKSDKQSGRHFRGGSSLEGSFSLSVIAMSTFAVCNPFMMCPPGRPGGIDVADELSEVRQRRSELGSRGNLWTGSLASEPPSILVLGGGLGGRLNH